MTRKSPTNLAESVRQRLLNLARQKGEDFQVTLNNYFLERFLYRLSRSKVHNRFVLKGALLLRLWAEQPYRATLDLDLLRQGESDRDAVATDIRAICATTVEPDGVEFDTRDLTLEPIREEHEYAGMRAGFTAKLGDARIHLQVDIGVGDAVWPAPRAHAYPTMLEFPPPHVLTYSREAVGANSWKRFAVPSSDAGHRCRKKSRSGSRKTIGSRPGAMHSYAHSHAAPESMLVRKMSATSHRCCAGFFCLVARR